MSAQSARLSLGFSCIGHTYSHLFAPIFFVAALGLEKELGLSHGETVALILIGNMLFGFAAPLAGWLGDKWSSIGMMGVFFLGMGAGMVATGMASTPVGIAIGLAATGLFAAIYHPVGIAWLVRNAESRGKALGINGVFGGIGPGVAAVMAGILIDWQGWRAAFLVPGGLMILTALLFYYFVFRGVLVESKVDRKQEKPASRRDMVRAIMVLVVTMLATGLIYQSTQPALPKAFSMEMTSFLNDGIFGLSTIIAAIYFLAGGMQVWAGHLADRYPPKYVYVFCFILQVPLLFLAGAVSGTTLALVAAMMVTINVGALPAENMLVARYAPSHRRGLVFGLKFILAFGIASLGIKLEGALFDATGSFVTLFSVLAAIAVVAATAGFLLPSDKDEPVPAAAE